MFSTEPVIIRIPRQSVWRDSKTSELCIHSRHGDILKVISYYSTGKTKQEALLRLDSVLWKLRQTAACVYIIEESVVEESRFGFTAKARWAIEDTLTFELIY